MSTQTLNGVFVMLVTVSAATVACMSAPLQPTHVNTDLPGAQAQQLDVIAMTPMSGPVGTKVTITGTGFARVRNATTFGQGYIRDIESTDGTTLTFTVPEGLDLCPPDSAAPCAGAHPRTRAGDYDVAVLVDGKKSKSLSFTVTP